MTMTFRNLWLGLSLLAGPLLMAIDATEAEFKAAFIYNFTKYVDWPASSLSAGIFNLCLVGGQNDLFTALTEMNGKQVKGGNSLRIRTASRTDDLKSCQMLVLSDTEEDHFTTILKRLDGLPVLTVDGSQPFLDAGGIINLFNENNKIRFDINLGAARRNNLTLSSNLLKLARTVR